MRRIWNRVAATLIMFSCLRQTNPSVLDTRGSPGISCTKEEKASCSPGSCKISHSCDHPEPYTCDCGDTAYLERIFIADGNPLFNVSCRPLPYDPCQICHPKYTIICKEISEVKAICECYPEFSESSNCHDLKNACEEVPVGASLSGNSACRTDKGNLCLPDLGSQEYTCVCIRPHQSSRSLGFPNCLADPQSHCVNQLCVGFNPAAPVPADRLTPRRVLVASESPRPEGERAVCSPSDGLCKCPSNWYHPHCTLWKGKVKPGSWSPWSPCHPDCLDADGLSERAGSSGVGFRVSRASCSIPETPMCQGDFSVWRRCKVDNLCTTERGQETEGTSGVSTAVAREIGRILKKHTEKENKSSGNENVASLSWLEKNYLLCIFLSVMMFGFIITIILMELIAGIRIPKENLNKDHPATPMHIK